MISGIHNAYDVFKGSTFHSQDLICNTPYCLPYNSYNAMSVNLVLDQLIILQFLSFLSHLIQDFEALYDTRMKLRKWESITGLLSIIN